MWRSCALQSVELDSQPRMSSGVEGLPLTRFVNQFITAFTIMKKKLCKPYDSNTAGQPTCFKYIHGGKFLYSSEYTEFLYTVCMYIVRLLSILYLIWWLRNRVILCGSKCRTFGWDVLRDWSQINYKASKSTNKHRNSQMCGNFSQLKCS